MRFRKILALLLCISMAIGFISCTSDVGKENDNGEGEKLETSGSSEDAGEENDDDSDVGHEPSEEDKAESKDEGKGTSTPLLYKVSDGDGSYVWLFGSIHVGREDYYPLPDYVMDAYNDSKSLAVEFDAMAFEEDTMAAYRALYKLAYLDGTTISDHVSQDIYEDAVEILKENGAYNKALDVYCASFWYNMISGIMYEKMGVDTENGIDMYFLNLAKKEDKEIIDVESAEIQYGMIADFSEDLQEILLESAVQSYYIDTDEMQRELDMLMDAWVKGNSRELTKLLNSESDSFESDYERELYEEYNTAMIVDRNIYMADFAEDALEDGETIFICVGAAHVVGEGAMADLLEERGYTVEEFGGK